MSVGEFFAEHRKSIDARKGHLARVGIAPPGEARLRDAMPSQADVVAPVHQDIPLIEATHPALVPAEPPKEYAQPKLPKLLGVNTDRQE